MSADATTFWSVHATADKEHGDAAYDIVTQWARTDEQQHVRGVAVEKLKDQALLAEIARTDVDSEVCKMAAKRLKQLGGAS